MDVASSGVWRYPSAVVRQLPTGWGVTLAGEAENVLPRGVLRDDDLGSAPTRLRSTVAEAMENLREAITEPDPRRGAERLAGHVQRHFALELCRHGLPYWHLTGRKQCTPTGSHDGVDLTVAHARGFVVYLDALHDAVEQVDARRSPLTVRQTKDLLTYVRLNSIEDIVRAELERDGRLELPRARQLVRMVIDNLTVTSGLLLSTRWPSHRSPQLAMVAWSSAALYVADLLLLLGRPDGSADCSVCGNRFSPRKRPEVGEVLYCQRPDCQRRRLAMNQARYRQRKRAEVHE